MGVIGRGRIVKFETYFGQIDVWIMAPSAVTTAKFNEVLERLGV